MQIKTTMRDFPGGPVGKNPPSNAGHAGLILGRGTKISHAAGQLSPPATTREAHAPQQRARVLQRSKDPAQPK